MAWVTFLSDYGLDDSFVGVCKGVIARVAPEARLLDICHQILRQDVEQGALTLAAAVPYLPTGLHLALVDPVSAVVVRPVAVQTADGAVFLSPDNGLTSRAWSACGGPTRAYELANSELFLSRPSRMFRGRDVFAPVAGHLAAGLALDQVGPEVPVGSLVRLTEAQARVHGDHVHGEVAAVDHFGNLALNMARSDLEAAGLSLGDEVELRVGGRSLSMPFVVTYGEVSTGRLAVCEDAYRRVTVAVNLGSAALRLRAARGDAVVVGRVPRPRAVRPAGERIGVLDPPVART
jgi:S-adenosylmethionine hydrolase